MARRLTRDTRHAVLGGVAAGFGRYLDVDPVVVRLAFVLGTLLGGVGLLFYLACWVIIPRDEATAGAPPTPEESSVGTEPPLDRVAGELRQAGDSLRRHLNDAAPGVSGPRLVVGCFLVLFGAVLLVDELHWVHWPHWARLATLWPTVLVVMGIALLVRSGRERPQ
jgi:phage shock protein PspC (stress-responsive transcriptional regulator)